MKYFRRQNFNPDKFLDDTILQKSDGNVELNPTQRVVIHGDLQVTGAIPGPETTNVLYVTKDGDDANTGRGLGPQQAKKTLKAALAVAQEGTTIYVKSGEYYEDNPLRVPPKVSIIGDTLRNTILRPLNGPESFNIIQVSKTSEYVTITTETVHELNVKDRVRVTSSVTAVNETDVNIVSVPTPTSFTYRQLGTDISATVATGTVLYGKDFFHVNSSDYIAQLVIKHLQAPAYCFNIDSDAIVDTSPYVQNCSNINGPWMKNGVEWLPFQTEQPDLTGTMVTGPRPLRDDEIFVALRDQYSIDITGAGGGMLIDGDRYNTQSPIKSMVGDAFTQVAQGGIGFHITNFGYMQLVSCFAVFCSKSFYTTRGGYLSISNSVCDFGYSAFEADGYYPDPYDIGTVNQNYYSTVGSVTVGSTGAGFTSPPSIIIDPPTSPGGRQATATAYIDPILGILTSIGIDDAGSGYDFQPNITISPSRGAAAIANLSKNLSIDIYKLANKPQVGSIAFLGDDPTAYYVNSTSNANQTFKYDEQKCARDVGIILDAVLADMTFGSTYRSNAAGLAYLRSYSSKVTSLQKSQTIAGINKARDLALSYTADVTAINRITAGFNTVTNIINTGLAGASIPSYPFTTTREAGYAEAASILSANKSFIQNEVTAWINDQYSTFIYDREKCKRDVKLILDAVLTDYTFGTNYWSKTAGLAYIRSYASNVTQFQKSQTIAGLNHARDLATALISDTDTITAITNSFATVTNIINTGSTLLATSFTDPVNPADIGLVHGAALIEINKSFIADELSAYITDNLNPGTIPGYNDATCRRDVKYIVDAIAFDMYYGGNSATVGAALAYYNYATSVVSAETVAFVSTFNRLHSIIGYISNANSSSWTKSVSNGSSQISGLPSGGAIASSQSQALVQIIIDTVIGGVDAAPTIQKPTYNTGTNYKLKNRYRKAILLEDDKIAFDTVQWLDSTYGNFAYSIETCQRDIAYIIDAMRYDLIYEGDSQTKQAALAYASGNVIDGQTEETKAAYQHWKKIVSQVVRNISVTPSVGNTTQQQLGISAGTPVPVYGPAQKCEELLQIIIDVVDHGTGYVPDPETPPSYTLGSSTYLAIRNSILAYTAAIQLGTVEYLNATYGGNDTVFFTPPIQSVLTGASIRFHNVSTVSTASTALEYVGSGVTYNALPFFGGEPDPTYERVEKNEGKCFTVTSDQIGNYRIGKYFNVNAITGEITIDAEKLNLSGLASIGPFKRNGIPVGVQLREVSDNVNLVASNGVIDHNTTPTQYAIVTYVENRYLNKVTTNAETVASSKVTYAGDLGVNGGDITTTAATFNIVNDTATTVNLAGAGTVISVGAATGTTTVNNNLEVKGSIVSTTQTSVNLLNTTATTVNAFGAATTMNFGAATGTATIKNPTVTFTNATNINVNGASPTIASTSTGTLTLFDTLITTVNAFRAATSINIGETSGTVSILSANTNLTGDLQVKGGDITTNQTTFNLINATATTVNAFGAATTLNFGAGSGTTTIANSLKVNIDSTFGSDTTSNFTASGKFALSIRDNTTASFEIKEATNSYIKINTDNAVELITLGALPKVSVLNTTDASSTSVASVIFSGGVGIAKKLYVGTDLNVAGSTTLGDDRTADTHTISGSTTINVPDNTAIAFQVKENTQTYITAVTTDLSESVTIEATPKLLVKNTTDNTLGTAATGSAQFSGGVGIAKNLTVGTNLTVNTDIVATGDLAVNGGDFTTTAATFNILNNNATTINFGGAGTAIAIGAATGTTNVKNNLDVDGDVNIDGGDLTVSTATFNLANTNATTGNLFGAGTAVNIATAAGAASTLTFGNATNTGNTVKVGSTAAGTINFTTDVTSGIVNAFQSVTGTVNFSKSGTVNIGTSTTAITTAVIGGAFTGNILKIAGTAAGTVSLTTDVTTGTANLVASVTGTINVGGAGTTVNLGTTGGNTTLEVRGSSVGGSATIQTSTGVTTANVFNAVATTGNLFGAGTTVSIGAATGTTTINNANTVVTGDLAVNGGDITTNQTTFNLLNTTATSVNAFGAGTTISIGAATGTTTINNANTVVTGDLAVNGGDITTSATTFNVLNTTATTVNAFGASTTTAIGSTASGTTTIGFDLSVNGDVQVKGGDITTNQTTFNLINTTATAVNIAGAGTTVSIGSGTGTTTINNANTVVAGDLQVKGGDFTVDAASTTFNIVNTNATTVNAFGAATVIAMGANSGTFTHGNPTIVGTQTTVNLWNTTSTTVNAFGAATSLNLGASSGTATINNAIVTTPGQYITTKANNTATGGGQIYLNGTTGNRIEFSNVGLGAPALTTRSVGTKLTVYPNVDATGVDYGIGMESAAMWLSVHDNTGSFKFYASTSVVATISGVGDVTYAGDLAVNGGDITTTQTTASVFNTTATTVSAFGAGTTISIGAATGTTTINNANTVVTGDLAVNGGDITTSATTFNLLNATATTVNAFGAATAISIGAATGTLTIGNSTITGTNATAFNMNGASPSIVTTSTGTASVFNTNVLTGNLFGVATSANIATSATGLSTLTFGPAITGNIFKIGSTAGGTINLTTDVTTGTINLFAGLTSGTVNLATGVGGTTNIEGDGGAVNIGTTAGDSTLTVRGNATAGTATLATNAATAKVFDANATTVNIAGAGTTVTLGNATSATLTIRPGTVVGSNASQDLYNTTTTTLNFAGAATSLNMGAATGTLTIGNPTITGTNATTFNMNGASPSIVTTSTATASVFNTNATTGNLFGVATTINIGTTAAAASTTSVGPAITGNTFKVRSTAAGTINLTTDVTSGIVNEWQSVTGTINIGASGTINLGTSTTAITTAVVGGAFTGNVLKIAGTVAGTVNLSSDVTTGIVNAFTGITTGTVNIATGGASTVNIGGTGSTTNIKQLTLVTNLAVQYGGTGLNTITTNGVVYGNGTSAAGVTAASNPGSNATTSYGILTTNVSNVPVWTDTIDGGSY